MQKNIIMLIIDNLRWFFLILKNFYSIVPIKTSLIFILSILSQLSITIYFLLPLKILIIISSNRIPNYLLKYTNDMNINNIIVILIVLVLVFFIIHYLLERLIEFLISKACSDLLDKSNKTMMFNNQRDIATNAYSKITKAMSSILFSLLILLVLAFLYTKLFIVIVCYLFLVLLLVIYLSKNNKKFNKILFEKTSDILNFINALGFFIVFLFIVSDIISGSSMNMLVILITILFTRQMLSQLFSSIKIVQSQVKNKHKISALFSHVHKYETNIKITKLWSHFVTDNSTKLFLSSIVNLHYPKVEFDYNWVDLAIKNVLAFKINLEYNNKRIKLFILFYDINIKYIAEYQYDLYKNHPDIIKHTFVDMGYTHDYIYHIFNITSFDEIPYRTYKSCKLNLIFDVMKTTPCPHILLKYKKSKLLIYDRIKKLNFNYLRLALKDEEIEIYENFMKILPKILLSIERLPSQYYNPHITLRNVFMDNMNNKVIIYWGAYVIEPLGVNFPIDKLDFIIENINVLKEERSDLKDINVYDICIVAYLSVLERSFNKQQFRNSIDTIIKLTKYYMEYYEKI